MPTPFDRWNEPARNGMHSENHIRTVPASIPEAAQAPPDTRWGIRHMSIGIDRRSILKTWAALAAGAAGGFACVQVASAAPIDVPAVDRLSLRILVDSARDQFLRPSTVEGVHIPPGSGRDADDRQVLHNQWGLSLLLESQQGADARSISATAPTRCSTISAS